MRVADASVGRLGTAAPSAVIVLGGSITLGCIP